jgi:hypothetical protein
MMNSNDRQTPSATEAVTASEAEKMKLKSAEKGRKKARGGR